MSVLFGEYRGKAQEDSADVAAALADLPEDARRAALRVVSEFAPVARDRDELKRQNEALIARLAESERRYLSETLRPAPKTPRKRPGL
ncbi:hypothetical protein [Paraburkholderia bannensis]|uniref:hypothetical protein n=1 Tax=Paraburkholderia bannensis TaxID=765414 RepID=UPI0005A6F7FF|nr:hypothetical protein [Paraburkholderia bannensis]